MVTSCSGAVRPQHTGTGVRPAAQAGGGGAGRPVGPGCGGAQRVLCLGEGQPTVTSKVCPIIKISIFGSIFFLLSVKSRQLLTDLRLASAPLEGRCLLPLQVSGGPFQTAGPERPRGKDNALEETSLRRQCREVQSPPEAAVAATLPLPSLWSRLLLNGLQYPGGSTANFG